MANHGYILTDSPISNEKLLSLMQEVNAERFGGKLTIETWDWCFAIVTGEGETPDAHCWDARCWWVQEADEKLPGTGPHNIEHRHGGRGDFTWWLDTVFSDELAAKLGGKVSDDGDGEQNDPRPGIYPTLRSYVENKWGLFAKKDPVGVVSMIEEDMKLSKWVIDTHAPYLAEFLG